MYCCAVAPPMGFSLRYHWLPDALLEVSVTLPPEQKLNGPPGMIVGAGGLGLTVTVVALDAALGQPLDVTTTVYAPAATATCVGLIAPPIGFPSRYH